MRQNEKRFINLFHIIFMVALVAVFLWFFVAQKIYPSEQNPQDYFVSELNYDWFYLNENQERIPMTVPGKCDCEKGEVIVFERTLPSDIPIAVSLRSIIPRTPPRSTIRYVPWKAPNSTAAICQRIR